MGILHVPKFCHNRSLFVETPTTYLANTTNNLIGIANTWTCLAVFKPFATTIRNVFKIGSTNNSITLLYAQTQTFQIIINNSAASPIKNYSYAGVGLRINTWAHVAFTWDGTTLQAYFDGVAVSPTSLTTDTTGTMTDTARAVGIGADSAGGGIGAGSYTQVACWNSALSAAEISSIFANGAAAHVDLRAAIGSYVSANNLKHWWVCGWSGDIGKDLGSGSPNINLSNGTAVEAADFLNDGAFDNAYNRFHQFYLDMDGTTERLRSVTAATIGIANAWSCLAFVNSGRDTTQETFFEIRNGGTNIDRIRFQKRGDLANQPLEVDIYAMTTGATIKDYLYNSLLPVGQWVGILATWDGTTLLLYQNGKLIRPTTLTTDSTGTMDVSTRQVGFGVGSQADQNFQGLVHSAAVWSTALTPDQAAIVSNPYYGRWLNLGTNGFGYTASSSLVQWFRGGLGVEFGSPIVGTAIIANDVFTSSINLNEGSANMAISGDMFYGGPGN